MTHLLIRLLLLALLFGWVGIVAPGCSRTSRGLAKITQSQYADASSGGVWVIEPPAIEIPEDRRIYISFVNTSEQTEINFTESLREGARAGGWEVVSDPTNVPLRVRVRLRYFGLVGKDSEGRDIAGQMGWVEAAATSEETQSYLDSQTETWAGEDSGGGLLSGLNLTGASTREWAAIFDVVLEERMDSERAFEKFDAVSGESTEAVSDYYPHAVRLSIWAHQIGMTEDEALAAIRDQIRETIAQKLGGPADATTEPEGVEAESPPVS